MWCLCVLWCAQVWVVPYVIMWECVIDVLVFMCCNMHDTSCIVYCACVVPCTCAMNTCACVLCNARFVLHVLWYVFTCILCGKPVASIWYVCVCCISVCIASAACVCYKCIVWVVYVYICKCVVCNMHVMWSTQMCVWYKCGQIYGVCMYIKVLHVSYWWYEVCGCVLCTCVAQAWVHCVVCDVCICMCACVCAHHFSSYFFKPG